MSCQAAGPLGTRAADTVLSRIAGETPDAIEPRFVAQCVSIGRRAGILQSTHADDTPARFYLDGRVAASIKEAICKGTLWGIRREARKPGSALEFRGSQRVDEAAATRVVAET